MLSRTSKRSAWALFPSLAGLLAGAWYFGAPGPQRLSPDQAPISALLPAAPDDDAVLEPQLASQERAGDGALPTYAMRVGGQTVEVVADAVMVRPALTERARASLEAIGSKVLHESPSGYWRVSVPAGESLEAFIARLKGDSGFSSVEPEGVLRATSLATGTIQYRSYQWNLDQIRWDQAMNRGFVDLGDLAQVTVAVVDSGVAYENYTSGSQVYVKSTDLANSIFEPGIDLIENDGHPNDVSGHGTHIANIIAADGGTLGVAPHVRIMPVRVLGADNAGTELGLVDGIRYAVDHGADVINLSLSFSYGYIPGLALADAIQHAEDNGVAVLASSGNLGVDQVSYPSAYNTVISVGASRLTAGRQVWIADYSNTGSGLDLVAPGGVSNMDVDRNGKSDGIIAQSIAPGNPASLHYYLMAGTSQAVAHASGAAAWLRALGAGPEEIRHALVSTSKSVWGKRAFWTREGMGVMDLEAAVRTVAMGPDGETEKPYYVNVLPLMFSDSGQVGALGLIKVVDSTGRPAKKVLVAGHWFGSSPSNFGVITNNRGEAWVSTVSNVSGSAPAVFGLQVDRVTTGNNRVTSAPRSYYYLGQGMLKSILSWYSDPRMEGANLIFGVEPNQYGMPSWVASSYVAKPLGALNAFAPTAVTCNGAFLSGLSSRPASDFATVTAQFSTPQGFSWGDATSLSVRVTDDVELADGREIRMGVAPLDLSVFYGDLASVFPLVNASSASLDPVNATWLSGLHPHATGAGTVTVLPVGSSVSLGNGLQATLAQGNLYRLPDGSLFTLSSNVKLNVPVGGGLTLADAAVVTLADASVVTLADASVVTLADAAVVTLADGTQRVMPAGSQLNIANGAVVTLADASVVTLADAAVVTLADASVVTLADAAVVTLADASVVTLADASVVTLADAAVVTLADASVVTLADGSVVTLADAAVVTLADASVVTLADAAVVTLADAAVVTLADAAVVTLADGAVVTLADGAFQMAAASHLASSLATDGGEEVLHSVAQADAALWLGEDGSVTDPSASSLSTLGYGTIELVELGGSSAGVPEMVAATYQEQPSMLPSPVDVAFQGTSGDVIFETPDVE